MVYPELDQIGEGLSITTEDLERSGYRLLTEAEWEAFCRAGTTTSRFFAEDIRLLDFYGWHSTNSGERIRTVGQLLPNAWGLFDMLGNAYEWCLDEYQSRDIYPVEVVEDRGDAIAPARGDRARVLRGGAFHRGPGDLRQRIPPCDGPPGRQPESRHSCCPNATVI